MIPFRINFQQLILLTDLWHDPKNRRKFFENYAKVNGFDPLNPNKWHSLPKEKILIVKVFLHVHKKKKSREDKQNPLPKEKYAC